MGSPAMASQFSGGVWPIQGLVEGKAHHFGRQVGGGGGPYQAVRLGIAAGAFGLVVEPNDIGERVGEAQLTRDELAGLGMVTAEDELLHVAHVRYDQLPVERSLLV